MVLYVGVTQAAHDGIGRKTPDAQQRAEQGGQHHADDRDPQGVEHSDQKGLPVRLGRLERDHRFADVETGGIAQEAEPALDAARGHVGQRVAGQVPDREGDQRQRQRLVDQTAKRLAAP